jgi:hypothetical protein
LYNNTLRFIKDSKVKAGVLSKTFLNDTNLSTKNLYSLPIFSDEPIVNSKLTTLKDFSLFSNEMIVDSVDETYESSKYVNYLYYLNYKNVINNFANNIQPLSYATVFDSFRSDYEDPFLYTDDINTDNTEPFLSTETAVDTNNNLKLSNPFKLRVPLKMLWLLIMQFKKFSDLGLMKVDLMLG